MNKLKQLLRKGGASSLASSLIAIVTGLFVGFVILLISDPKDAVEGLGVIVAGGFNGGMKGIGMVLYYATPLIMTGLSVGFAFKTGLFNIGAPGQLMVGGFAAIYVGYTFTFLPGWLLWIVALLSAMLAGGLWGAVPGFFKAKLNVNVVIACIMCNYIGMHGINFLLRNSAVYDSRTNHTKSVLDAALPTLGLDKIFYNMIGEKADTARVNAGFLIAIAIAVLIYFVLNRTKFGYELKACGYNRDASQYAGINESRSILLSMAISGALAGIAGGLIYLAPILPPFMHVEEVLAAQGFNGIPVALLGLSNPIGIIFSALFVSYISEGGFYLQRQHYPKEIIDIIIATIIYFSAFSLLVKNALASFIKKQRLRREAAGQPPPGAEAAETPAPQGKEEAGHE